MDSNEAIEQWLKRNFSQIFQNELKDCPQKRTFKIFQEWFEHEIHSMASWLKDTGFGNKLYIYRIKIM